MIARIKRSCRGTMAIAALFLGLSAGPVDAGAITFTGSHGDVFYADLNGDGTPDPGFDGTGLVAGVTVKVINPNKTFDLGVIFDTTATSTRDPDLEDPFTGGNLAGTTLLGGIAIIQENNVSTPLDGSVGNAADDEGRRPAGSFTFEFDVPVIDFGFDVVDVEGSVEALSTMVFVSGGTSVTVSFMDLKDRDGTVSFGNNSLNRINPFFVGESLSSGTTLLGPAWDKVTINLGGSGGIDNVVFTHVPEPSSLALLGMGAISLFGCCWRRKRTQGV